MRSALPIEVNVADVIDVSLFPDPAKLRAMAAKWRTLGTGLDSLADTVRDSLGKAMTWSGDGRAAADVAKGVVETSIRQVAKAVHEFANQMDVQAQKAQEAIDQARKEWWMGIFSALLEIATFGLGALFGKVITAVLKAVSAAVAGIVRILGRVIVGGVTRGIAKDIGTFAANFGFWGGAGVGIYFGAEGLANLAAGTQWNPDYAMAGVFGFIGGLTGGLIAVGDPALRADRKSVV